MSRNERYHVLGSETQYWRDFQPSDSQFYNEKVTNAFDNYFLPSKASANLRTASLLPVGVACA